MERFKSSILAIVVLLIGAGILVFVVKTSESPSQEMVGLKQLEKQLAVPAPVEQKADDRGTYKDENGDEHTVRHRLFYYTDRASIEKFVKALPSAGWSPVTQEKDGKSATVAFAHPERYSCVFITIDSETSKYPHNIFLKSGSDDSCKQVIDKFKQIKNLRTQQQPQQQTQSEQSETTEQPESQDQILE